MRLIVIRESRDGRAETGTNLLRYALSTAPLADLVVDGLRRLWCCRTRHGPVKWVGRSELANSVWAVPENWRGGLAADPGRVIFYTGSRDIDLQSLGDPGPHAWMVISNGRFAAHVNCRLLGRVLADTGSDVVIVTAASDLLAHRERVRLTHHHELVGYRRLYADSAAPSPVPVDWPDHLFVRREAVGILFDGGLPSSFDALVEKCRTHELSVQSVAIAGSSLDLESESGILALCTAAFRHSSGPGLGAGLRNDRRAPTRTADEEISPASRFLGPVLLGKRVIVEAGVVVVGPSILCDDSIVRQGAIVDSSILGTDTSVGPNQVIRSRIVAEPLSARTGERAGSAHPADLLKEPLCACQDDVFRVWPAFSYARCFKRMADIAAALVALMLFAPVIPFIALAIKLNSPGPVFFRDKRQGLHGEPFDCIKFRTMRAGSDKIQEKLRFVSEVDGPQFKMADDPRITAVGRFLRETYLDEIPQFFNVLCGPMSVVGPRPSPESENTLCPSWRDARLSVRPGITGLWQVCRTRQPQKDFQEWIHYDMRYVRELSLPLDLWICWRTFGRMLSSFAGQF
jgi:lipopolysaccharide/colanic/teichoic acid biosynthesis glycosyltransferase